MGIMPPIGGIAIGGIAIGGMAIGGMAAGGDAIMDLGTWVVLNLVPASLA